MHKHICQVNRRVIHPCADEGRARARGVSDGEGILGEGIQDSTGIVEKFEGLITGIGDGRGDLQVLQSVNVDVWGRGLEGQAWGSRDGDRKGDQGDEGSPGGREHRGEATSLGA